VASAFSHAVVALALGKTVVGVPIARRFWALSVGCSILPDADVLGFGLGIPYSHMLGHRGLSHSLAFALVLAVVVVRYGFREVAVGSTRWWLLLSHFFLVAASHGLLDAMTNGGLGVAFFAPFDDTRYFLPWRPVYVSPIGIAPFFSRYGMTVLASEVLWIWVPALLITAAAGAARKVWR